MVCDDVAAHDDGTFAVTSDGDVVAWSPPAATQDFEVRIAGAGHGLLLGDPARRRSTAVVLERVLAALVVEGVREYNITAHLSTGAAALHDHLHVLPSTRRRSGIDLATGYALLVVAPERAAAKLRDQIG